MAENAEEESTFDQTRGISIAVLNEIKREVKKGGIARLETFVNGRLEEWKHAKVSVAVIGRSGAGKSTFINAFLDLDDDEAAETGVTETTMGIQAFNNPKYPNITLWDLPGVGTKNFPKETYLKDIKVENYDIFILMTSVRFTDEDECNWLARELKKIGRVIFFVRTKVLSDVRNFLRGNMEDQKKIDKLVLKIREECSRYLAEFIDPQDKLFLIDSHDPTKVDFDKLQHDMVVNLPENKKEALLEIFHSFSPNLIKIKGEVLKKRILYSACISGAAGVVSIPGTSLAIDSLLLTELRDKFSKDLGLNKDFLSNLRKGTIPSSLHDIVKRAISNCLEECMEEALKRVTVSEVVEQVSAFIPLIGPLISSSVSFAGTHYAATKMLDRMVEDALRINKMIADEVAKNMSAT